MGIKPYFFILLVCALSQVDGAPWKELGDIVVSMMPKRPETQPIHRTRHQHASHDKKEPKHTTTVEPTPTIPTPTTPIPTTPTPTPTTPTIPIPTTPIPTPSTPTTPIPTTPTPTTPIPTTPTPTTPIPTTPTPTPSTPTPTAFDSLNAADTIIRIRTS